MRAYILPAILALTHFTALTLTAPLTTDNLTPLEARTHDSLNAADQAAETHSALVPRTGPPIWWNDPAGSGTKILITFMSRYPGHFILKLITTAYVALNNHISANGDGLLPGGIFEAEYSGLNLWTRNSNNHQQTFGVLKGVLNALNHYMFTEQIGSATFVIFDGMTQVGVGGIGPKDLFREGEKV